MRPIPRWAVNQRGRKRAKGETQGASTFAEQAKGEVKREEKRVSFVKVTEQKLKISVKGRAPEAESAKTMRCGGVPRWAEQPIIQDSPGRPSAQESPPLTTA